MAREFEELALDGHNYPTWALDIKISLASKNILSVLLPPNERVDPLHDAYKYNALYIIRHHLHPDLKEKYVMEEEPNVLWLSLKNRYEQQKAVILPEANHDGPIFVCKTISLLVITTMLFIRSVLACVSAARNHQMRIRLKKHFKL
jgi:hypothetical protein